MELSVPFKSSNQQDSAQGSDNFLSIDFFQVEEAYYRLSFLDNYIRQQIVEIILKNGKLKVMEIHEALKLKQAIASQNLACLRKAGIVLAERVGRNVYYSINDTWIKSIQNFIGEITKKHSTGHSDHSK